MPLSDTRLRQAKAAEKPYKIYDSDGLFVIINPNGKKWWRFKYRFDEKAKELSLGIYPDVTLKAARKARDDAHELLLQGIDPSQKRKDEKQNQAVNIDVTPSSPTFEQVGREWYAKNVEVWSPKYGEKQLIRLEAYIFPKIGSIPIANLKTADYARIVADEEAKNHIETAHRVAQLCSQISRYACAADIIEYNFAIGVGETIKKVKQEHFATITDPKEIGHMLAAIEEYEGSPSTRFAIRIMPYVFVRSGELRGARWSEIDLDKGEWTIPAERMKMRRPHVVPLAPQVVDLFNEMLDYSGNGELVFPGYTSKNRCITDVALLNILRRLGYDRDQMTIHGFRSTASTLLNEMGYNRDWIEMQLAHSDKNAIRGTYNRAEWLPERRKMMREWADYIDGLRKAARGI